MPKGGNNGMTDEEIIKLKESAIDEIRNTLDKLEKANPEILERLGVIGGGVVGGVTGGAISLATLFFGGKVVGLSAAGITSGLAAAGVGGGMVIGVGVLALPIVTLAAAGYAGVKIYKKAKITTASNNAISNLYDIQSSLIQHEELFKEEISYIEWFIALLKKR